MTPPISFDDFFHNLTGYKPLSWQTRLYDDFVNDDIRAVIDLPTGLGKTMVMAIWLLARLKNPKLGRRLIYVVDRRTVVDQATDMALRIRDNAKKVPTLEVPAISTLRGQLADNREWSRDPSKPAIIIGTVDLIGSALLFSGYRSSYKRRPLEAGLLGQDSLLVLDEAHLSKPFEKLVTSVSSFQSGKGSPIKVIRMSATRGDSTTESPFTLLFDEQGNLTREDAKDETIHERFNAKKTLSIIEIDAVIDSIATAAGELAKTQVGSRIVIFVRTPKQVDDVRKTLIKKDKTCETRIAMLTGTMRGLERDELVTTPTDETQHERRVMQRFLKPENDPSPGECFLISTSAGEVGFDLNADHMVCDLTTLDSLIQRLGRVNRRGGKERSAVIKMFAEVPNPKLKDGKPQPLPPFDSALKATYDLLDDRSIGGQLDVSPSAIATLKKSLTSEQLKAASTPDPTMVELTDILLDAWSMTSITAPMPGRPEVAPWIRGIAEELPQTTIAWRAELDLPGFEELDLETIEEWFDSHRILTHETLSVPTREAAKQLLARWQSFEPPIQESLGRHLVIVDRAGIKPIRVADFMRSLERDEKQTSKTYDTIRNADLILPASFGGIERGKGLLDADVPQVPKDEGKQPISPDVADERSRFRELITKTEDAEPVIVYVGSGTKPPKYSKLVLDLVSDDDKRVQLISYISKLEKLELGLKKQTLSEHVGLVRKYVDDLLNRLNLPESIRRAAQLAADFHDHGKNRERWQRTVKGTATPAGQPWTDATLGKSGGEMKRDPRGYRHEFGSLREFIDAREGKVEPEVFDLALHLIAVHHGRGRPHFPIGGFDPDDESRSPDIHTAAIRRFAQLQRIYGHWQLAWLENLLRCADQLASADQEAEDDMAEESAGSGGGAP